MEQQERDGNARKDINDGRQQTERARDKDGEEESKAIYTSAEIMRTPLSYRRIELSAACVE